MDDVRYIILPGDIRKDGRLTLSHWKVALVLGAYSKRHGWTDLTQADVGEMAGVSRQTVCEAVGDLVSWGWVARRKKDKKNQYVYRFIMDRDDYCQPQPTVGGYCQPQPTEHCQPQPTTNVGTEPTFNKEESSTLRQSSYAPLPPSDGASAASGQEVSINREVKGGERPSSGVRPSIRIRPGDVGWTQWLETIESRLGEREREAAVMAGEIRVSTRWPTDETPMPAIARVPS